MAFTSTDVEKTFVLEPQNPHRARIETNLHDFVANLPRDQSWRIEIGLQLPTRSQRQNRTFHMWCNQVARAKGWAKSYAKAYFKGMFGPLLMEVKRGDKIVEVVKSTGEYSVKEMAETMTQMEIWAGENDVELTYPEGETR